jgi:hypothetical protein
LSISTESNEVTHTKKRPTSGHAVACSTETSLAFKYNVKWFPKTLLRNGFSSNKSNEKRGYRVQKLAATVNNRAQKQRPSFAKHDSSTKDLTGSQIRTKIGKDEGGPAYPGESTVTKERKTEADMRSATFRRAPPVRPTALQHQNQRAHNKSTVPRLSEAITIPSVSKK